MNDMNTIPVFSKAVVRPKSLANQQVACDHCAMFGLCEEAGLSRDTQLLEQVVSRRTALARHAKLFSAHTPFNDIYAVKSGALAAVGEDSRGNRKVFGFYFPGDILGLDAIDDGQYHDTVVALEKSSVCRLHYESAPLLGEHQARFYQQMIHAMSNRLRSERWTSKLLGTQSTEQRLAAFMIYLSLQLQSRGLPHLEFRLPMTRRDIADYLGIAMETVSRTFSSLQKKGLLALQGRNTLISDPEGLLTMASLEQDLTNLVRPL
jgi:CRP/FNR family transcriptional regulator